MWSTESVWDVDPVFWLGATPKKLSSRRERVLLDPFKTNIVLITPKTCFIVSFYFCYGFRGNVVSEWRLKEYNQQLWCHLSLSLYFVLCLLFFVLCSFFVRSSKYGRCVPSWRSWSGSSGLRHNLEDGSPAPWEFILYWGLNILMVEVSDWELLKILMVKVSDWELLNATCGVWGCDCVKSNLMAAGNMVSWQGRSTEPSTQRK